MNDSIHNAIAKKIKALGAPVRVRIATYLADGPKTVNEIVAMTGEKQANLSKHLKIMAEGNVVRAEAEGAFRHYSLTDDFAVKTIALAFESLKRERKPGEEKVKILKSLFKGKRAKS